jgi:drug/metabolite transporter (DMT)-like permease
LGWPAICYVPIAAISMISYIAALKLTSVANVITIYATIPFVAAAVAYLVMRERVDRYVMIASGVAFLGVVIMAGVATDPRDVAGNLIALLMTVCFAITIVMARRWPSLDLTMAIALACALCSAVCFTQASSAIPSVPELGILFVFSVATQSLSYLLFVIGGRHIPAAEAGLIALLDVVLAPLWVWMAFSESPGNGALIGGSLTLLAVLLYTVRGLGGSRRAGIGKAPAKS